MRSLKSSNPTYHYDNHFPSVVAAFAVVVVVVVVGAKVIFALDTSIQTGLSMSLLFPFAMVGQKRTPAHTPYLLVGPPSTNLDACIPPIEANATYDAA